jgi:hypothetical protein
MNIREEKPNSVGESIALLKNMAIESKLKVYCAGAIRGDTRFLGSFSLPSVIENIEKLRGLIEVRSEAIHSEKYQVFPADKNPYQVFERDIGWLKESDAVIAEVSGESTGTGWEICLAHHTLGIPVLCFIRPDVSPPCVVAGNPHKNIFWSHYSSPKEIEEKSLHFLEPLLSVRDKNSKDQRNDALRAIGEVFKRHDFESRRPCGDVNRERYFVLDFNGTRNHSLLVALSKYSDKHQSRLVETLQTAVRDSALRSDSVNLREVRIDCDTSDFESNFKEVKRLVAETDGAMFEVSGASTDLGWLVCYSQTKRKVVACTYENTSRVSFMILGNSRAFEKMSRHSTHDELRKSFVDILDVKAYDGPNEWKTYFLSFVREFRDALMRPGTLADVNKCLSKFFASSGEIAPYNRVEKWRIDIHSQHDFALFLAKYLFLQDRWRRITKKGLEGALVSGERGRLITVLPRYDRLYEPSGIHKEEKFRIGYEERALAKNIRGLKDIGLLLGTVRERRRVHSTGSSKLKTIEGCLKPEIPDKQKWVTESLRRRQATESIPRRVVLTNYGFSLSQFLFEYGDAASFLLKAVKGMPRNMDFEAYDSLSIDDDLAFVRILDEHKSLKDFLYDAAMQFARIHN